MIGECLAWFAQGAACGAALALLVLRLRRRRSRRLPLADAGDCVELVIAHGRLIEFAVAGTRDDGSRWQRRLAPPPDA